MDLHPDFRIYRLRYLQCIAYPMTGQTKNAPGTIGNETGHLFGKHGVLLMLMLLHPIPMSLLLHCNTSRQLKMPNQ